MLKYILSLKKVIKKNFKIIKDKKVLYYEYKNRLYRKHGC